MYNTSRGHRPVQPKASWRWPACPTPRPPAKQAAWSCTASRRRTAPASTWS